MLVVVAVLALAAPALLVRWDEAAVPPSSDVPALPADVTITADEVFCGSGGCYRTVRLRPAAGQTPLELATVLALPHEECSARSLLDRRVVCTGLHVLDDEVSVYLLFDR